MTSLVLLCIFLICLIMFLSWAHFSADTEDSLKAVESLSPQQAEVANPPQQEEMAKTVVDKLFARHTNLSQHDLKRHIQAMQEFIDNPGPWTENLFNFAFLYYTELQAAAETLKLVVVRIQKDHKKIGRDDLVQLLRAQNEYSNKHDHITSELLKEAQILYEELEKREAAAELETLKGVIARMKSQDKSLTVANLESRLRHQDEYKDNQVLAQRLIEAGLSYFVDLENADFVAKAKLRSIVKAIHGKEKHLQGNGLLELVQREYKGTPDTLTSQLFELAQEYYLKLQNKYEIEINKIKAVVGNIYAEDKQLSPDNLLVLMKEQPDYISQLDLLTPDVIQAGIVEYFRLVSALRKVRQHVEEIQATQKHLSRSGLVPVLQGLPDYKANPELLTLDIIEAAQALYRDLSSLEMDAVEELKNIVRHIQITEKSMTPESLKRAVKSHDNYKDNPDVLTDYLLNEAAAFYVALEQKEALEVQILKDIISEIQKAHKNLLPRELDNMLNNHYEYRSDATPLTADLLETAHALYKEQQEAEAAALEIVKQVAKRIFQQKRSTERQMTSSKLGGLIRDESEFNAQGSLTAFLLTAAYAYYAELEAADAEALSRVKGVVDRIYVPGIVLGPDRIKQLVGMQIEYSGNPEVLNDELLNAAVEHYNKIGIQYPIALMNLQKVVDRIHALEKQLSPDALTDRLAFQTEYKNQPGGVPPYLINVAAEYYQQLEDTRALPTQTMKSVVAGIHGTTKQLDSARLRAHIKNYTEYQLNPTIWTPELFRAADEYYAELEEAEAIALRTIHEVVARVYATNKSLLPDILRGHLEAEPEFQSDPKLTTRFEAANLFYKALEKTDADALNELKSVVARIYRQTYLTKQNLSRSEMEDALKKQPEYTNHDLVTTEVVDAADEHYKHLRKVAAASLRDLKEAVGDIQATTKKLSSVALEAELRRVPKYKQDSSLLTPDLVAEAKAYYNELEHAEAAALHGLKEAVRTIQATSKKLTSDALETQLRRVPKYKQDPSLLTPELVAEAKAYYEDLELADAAALNSLKDAVRTIQATLKKLSPDALEAELKSVPKYHQNPRLLTPELVAAAKFYYDELEQADAVAVSALKEAVGTIQATLKNLSPDALEAELNRVPKYQQDPSLLTPELVAEAKAYYNKLELADAVALDSLKDAVRTIQATLKTLSPDALEVKLKSVPKYMQDLSLLTPKLVAAAKAYYNELELAEAVALDSLKETVRTIQASLKKLSPDALEVELKSVPKYQQNPSLLTPKLVAAAKAYYNELDTKEVTIRLVVARIQKTEKKQKLVELVQLIHGEREYKGKTPLTQPELDIAWKVYEELEHQEAAAEKQAIIQNWTPFSILVVSGVNLSQFENKYHEFQDANNYYIVPRVIIVHFGKEALPYAYNIPYRISDVAFIAKASQSASAFSKLNYKKMVTCHKVTSNNLVETTAIYKRKLYGGSHVHNSDANLDVYGLEAQADIFYLNVFDIPANAPLSLANIPLISNPLNKPSFSCLLAKGKNAQTVTSELGWVPSATAGMHSLSLEHGYFIHSLDFEIATSATSTAQFTSLRISKA